MLQTSSTITVNLTTGAKTPSVPIAARSSLAITLTGIGSLVAANIKSALYRFSPFLSTGTLVATCDSFTLSGSTFVGAMSLNTAELVAAFTDLPTVRQYQPLRFWLLIYDSSASVYIVVDNIDVSYEYPLVAGTPPAVSPITSSTTVFGNLKLISGVVNIWDVTDSQWHPITASGAGSEIHINLDQTGVP